jgi:uncharacterized alkaline shock family protein YloU
VTPAHGGAITPHFILEEEHMSQQTQKDTSDRTDASRSPARRDGGSLLQSDRGATSIQDSVVGKIASLAAREVSGVSSLGGAAASALGSVVGRIRGDEHSTSGVGVEVGERQAAMDIAMKVEYPARIHEVANAVRQNVIDRVETMTGLEVVEVNVAVIDLEFPGGEDEAESESRSRVG